jgi:hypothetical protein
MDVIHLTEQEKQLIEKAAQQAGMTLEQYLAHTARQYLQQATEPYRQAASTPLIRKKTNWH